MTTRIIHLAAFTLLAACGKSNDQRGYEPPPPMPELVDPGTKPAQAEPEKAPPSDEGLRKAYGADDMRYADCVERADDGSIALNECPEGFAVFGPYVDAPAESDLEVAFTVSVAQGKARIFSDVASSVGKRTHGSIGEREVASGGSADFSYRIHMFEHAEKVEARIGIKNAEAPVALHITNLRVEVH